MHTHGPRLSGARRGRPGQSLDEPDRDGDDGLHCGRLDLRLLVRTYADRRGPRRKRSPTLRHSQGAERQRGSPRGYGGAAACKIALQGTSLFWTDVDAILSVGLDGGAPTTISSTIPASGVVG